MRRSTTFAVVVCAGAAVALTGCASSSSNGAGGSASDITLMTINSIGSPIQNYPDVPAGAEAAAKAINDAGGINGHKIVIEVCNTSADANKATACARKAATDKVAAVVSQQDLFAATTLPILQAAGIPSVGLISSGNPSELSAPNSYPFGAGSAGGYLGIPFGLKDMGIDTIATAVADVAPAKGNSDNVKRGAEAAGVDFKGSVSIPLTGVTDYTPYAQKLKDLGAKAVALVTTPGQTQALMKATADLGLDIQYAHNAFSFGEADAATVGPAADGILLAGSYPSVHDDANAAIKKFNAEMEAAGKTDAIDLRPGGINGWLSVYAVKAVAEKINGDITAKSLTDALNGTTGLDLQGLATFSPSQQGPEGFTRVPSSMEYFTKIQNGTTETTDIAPVDVMTKL